jgi:hypothetical protein
MAASGVDSPPPTPPTPPTPSTDRPPDSASSDARPTDSSSTRWGSLLEQLSTVAGVLAPTTVITALLYYYGYVATYARFGYFGVDLATLRLSTQDLVLKSVAVLYVPCAVLLGLGIAYLVIRNRTRMALAARARWRSLRRVGRVAVALGVGLIIRAVVGVVVPSVAVTEFPATTPMALGAGTLSLLYGRHLLRNTVPGRGDMVPGNAVVILGAGIVILSLFWAANTFAAAYGSGQAERDSKALTSRPAVTLDTRERLYLNTACAEETLLPADTDQSFRYRNRGLRLLAVGSDRLFLIPDRWRDGCQILVVRDDDSVRIQLGR